MELNLSKSFQGDVQSVYCFEGDRYHVALYLNAQVWEYEDENDSVSYCSGTYEVADNTVIDYDGVFELPKAVVYALELEGFKLDPFINDIKNS